MFCLKGFNTILQEWVYLIVYEDGMIVNESWSDIQRGSIKQYAEILDKDKRMIWEDDELINEKNGEHLFVRFGEYETENINGEFISNRGFYLENEDLTVMPIGSLEESAIRVVGDINSDLDKLATIRK